MLSTEHFSESVPRKFSQNFKSNFSNFLKLPPSKMEPKKKENMTAKWEEYAKHTKNALRIIFEQDLGQVMYWLQNNCDRYINS